MAHNLNFRNGKASVFVVGTPAWHKLGRVLDKPANAEEAIKAAQLDYQVNKWRIEAKAYVGKHSSIDVTIPDKFATVRTDTNQVLGIVGSGYQVLQNTDAFSFFDPLIDRSEAIYESAGALGEGEKVWMMAKLPDYIRLGNGDDVGKYLLLTNSHDGSEMVRVKFTPVRVVCQNTLNAALKGTGNEIRIRHTSGMKDKLEEAHKIMKLSSKVFAQIGEIFSRMTLTKVTDKQLVDYIKALVPDGTEEAKERIEKTRGEIRELALVGKGQEMRTARGTLWGAYNGIVEYVDYAKKMRADDGKRLSSIWFGAGETMKEHAFEAAVNILETGRATNN